MRNRHIKAILLVVSLFLLSGFIYSQRNEQALSYLHPEIGSVGRLLQPVRPIMQLPNQMIRITPTRRDYLDDQISNFPLQIVSHYSGPIFLIMPNVDARVTENSWNEKLAYDQDLEVLDPWHYRNYFLGKDISVDFVPGKKTGIYRFAFPAIGSKNILFGTYSQLFNYWKIEGRNSIEAMQYFPANNGNKNVPIYMYGRFSAVPNFHSFNGNGISQDSISGKGVKLYCSFHTSDSVVEFRYAISYISENQAKQNFEEELPPSVTLEKLAAQGKNAWADVIGQIQVEGGNKEQKESFYTALYRCYSRMVNITEDGRYYSGYDNKVHTDKRPFYVDDGIWDTYIALHPLRMILRPSMEEDMLQSYVRMYEQGGWLPQFPSLYGDIPCMNGFHSSILFLDAYRKGLKNVDYETANKGMVKNGLEATLLPWRNGSATKLDSFYYKHGYLPALHPDETEPYAFVNPFEKRQAVAVTLGTSYDDWAVGQMAKELGKQNDFLYFDKRSNNYKNLWNAQQKFFLPKDSAGNWIMIDPKWDGGMGGRYYYDENNGWTYLWQVQENIPELMKLMGGKKGFEGRLDQLFREGLGGSKYAFWAKFPDATGLVGEFSMGNEPSFFIPYLYDFTDAPWKTQERVRILLRTWFHNDIFGMPGDEDGGGMSAFVVFSSMGFYPVTPGRPIYAIGSPVFSKVSIRLLNGKAFTVIAHDCSKENKYVQWAKMNGVELKTPFFTHQQLMNGGTLELQMGDRPNKIWGVVH